jgi:hypothetical protein
MAESILLIRRSWVRVPSASLRFLSCFGPHEPPVVNSEAPAGARFPSIGRAGREVGAQMARTLCPPSATDAARTMHCSPFSRFHRFTSLFRWATRRERKLLKYLLPRRRVNAACHKSSAVKAIASEVPVAQLDRVSASGAEGSAFESRRGY